MKKIVRIILLFVMAVYVAIALTAVINAAVETPRAGVESVSSTAESTVPQTKTEQGYIVKSVSGRVAVEEIATGKIVRTTDTRVAILPEKDCLRLSEGITVKTKTELRSVLEDLCS